MTTQFFPPLESAIAPISLIVSSDISLLEAILKLSRHHESLRSPPGEVYILVRDRQTKVGIVTKHDIFASITAGYSLEAKKIAEITQMNLIAMQRSELQDLNLAIELLRQHRVQHLLLLNDQKEPSGVLSHSRICGLLQPLDLLHLSEVLLPLKEDNSSENSQNLKQELEELKSRFISMTSHQLRTPLSVITSSAGILKDFGDKLDSDKRQKHLQCIQTYVKHATQLLDDILLLNKAETGNLAFEPALVDVVNFCGTLVDEFQLSATANPIHFSALEEAKTHGEQKLKSSTGTPVIQLRLDQKLLRQILLNLLSNSAKYSPSDSVIELSVMIGEQHLTFTITDQGIGIPEEDHAQLFQPFHRAKNVGNVAGTGLGLSIVHKCVELHQGQISVSSQLNLGTTVTVVIPIQSE